ARFVHVSSIVTLGHSDVPRDESAAYDAQKLRLAYWDTKAEAERLALTANHPPDFEVIMVNPGSLLGPGEKNGQLLPFVKKLAGSERPFLPDGGSDFLDVRDAAKGTVLALEKGKAGERYVLGAENLTYAGFHKKLREAIGKNSAPRIAPRWMLAAVENVLGAFEGTTGIDLPINAARLRRVNGVYMFHDLSKAKKELGYSPGPIESALRAMLEE
ncbi:MAG: NAD-dependent epimerase/dehydratase family protein, partial [Deltaproteobacteria bacterium]|nr:NAD-dependent epimerase/dehydratase family protein [Deltaproteobacteria bacterium]